MILFPLIAGGDKDIAENETETEPTKEIIEEDEELMAAILFT